MTIRGETSADSAARFIAMRSSPSNGLSVMIAERCAEKAPALAYPKIEIAA